MMPGNALTSEWGTPWRDEETLRQLYHEEGMTLQEVGDELGCSHATVKDWMERHGVPIRSQSEANQGKVRVERATHRFTGGGYEEWQSWHDGDYDTVQVHQLLACLNHDPHEVFAPETVVHHKSGHPRDNRPGNVEVLTRSEHSRLHAQEDLPECKRDVLQTAARAEGQA